MLGVLASFQGQGEQAEEHDRAAVALLQDAGPSEGKARVLANLAGSLLHQAETTEAIRVGRQALAIADTLGLEERRVPALISIGCARVAGGDPEGIADIEQAVAIAVAANSPSSGRAYNHLAYYVTALGDLARGFQLQAKAREAAERFGIAGDLRAFRVDRAFEDYWRGRWDMALREVDQHMVESRAGLPKEMEPACRILRGWIRLARGDHAGVLEDASIGLRLGRAAKDVQTVYALLALHAHGLLAVGDAGQAGAQATELLGVVAQIGPLITAPDWSGELAVVLEALGRGTELLELVAPGQASSQWLRAAAAIATGDFERAAELYAEIGSLPDEAFARLRAAERLLAAGRQAEGYAQLQQALGFYRQVQASAYVRQAEALLAASA
jgi:tetratricopeptide (TPR) repeat protein